MRILENGAPIAIWVALVAGAASAGQLEPPGPVGPTDRTTLNGQQIQPPYTIRTSGSYVLTSDIRDCIPCDDLPTNGILIAASDVTLDLNGFAVVGAPANSLTGIVVQPGRDNIVIKNGVVRDWSVNGIDTSDARGSRIENVRVSNNGGGGIVSGMGSIVQSSIASSNGGQGILVAPGSVVAHCTATDNQQDGIVAVPTAVPAGSTISGCNARGNGGNGILAGDGTTIADSGASANGGHGISTGVGCTIRGNAVTLNVGDGILTFDSLVQGNAASFNNGAEINATGSTVVDNHVVP